MYQITRVDEATVYQPARHYDMRATRLHNACDVQGQLTAGLSHFLPGGGAEMGVTANELLYYIVEGEMTVTTDDGKAHILKAGDSIHFGVGQGRASQNTGAETAKMLVISCPARE